jgi:hypothetical protein
MGEWKKNSKNIAEDQGQSEWHTMSSNKVSADSKETAEMSCLDAPAEQNKKKKRRAEGRPHKRLLEPLLFKRKEDVGAECTSTCATPDTTRPALRSLGWERARASPSPAPSSR